MNANSPPVYSPGSPDRRFRIALSFSGERRDFVARIATLLATRFGEDRILYDRFHEAEFAHPDLGLTLPRLYHQESDLVVVVMCGNYENKEWCGLEWRAIFGLVKQKKVKQVMLTRFDNADCDDLHGLAGFVDLDTLSAEAAVTSILQRLALNEGRAKDFYIEPSAQAEVPGAAGWPDSVPDLHWPIADHASAKTAFASFITRQSQFRVLSICGASETGKSLLTKQFQGNALSIPDLNCGRLDFKRSAGMDVAMQDFAHQLGLAAPAAHLPLTNQLGHLASALAAARKPTLLIFDTFEAAGDADQWIRDNLMINLFRGTWLRVIIVGQKTVSSHDSSWAHFCAPPVQLRLPSAQDWFDFGKHHRPDVTIEDINTFLSYTSSSALIAQLLRPAA